MIELLNIAGAIGTVAMGFLGLLFPKSAAKFVGLKWQTPHGQSEFRATYGGLWLPLGIVPLVSMSPVAFLMTGLCWLGAAVGRILSIIVDQTNTSKNWVAVAFRKTFTEDTELTGNMKLRLWVEAEGAKDMDLFVAIKKYDADGNEVTFFGKAGYAKTPVALGWLRVSQRELDPERSTPLQPILKHERSLKLTRGEVVPVEVEILPSSTLFRTGETLEVAIQGRDHFKHHALAHEKTVNKGRHVIHFGGDYDSYILVPIIPYEIAD